MTANLTTRDVSVLLNISRQRFRALREKFPIEAPIPKRLGPLYLWTKADVQVFKKLRTRVRPYGVNRKAGAK